MSRISTYLSAGLLAAVWGLGAAQAAVPKSITVGIEDLYYPFSYAENGRRFGFDYEFASSLCRRMEVKCEFKALPFEELTPSLLEDKSIDMIVAGLGQNEERLEAGMSFTHPYYRGPSIYLTLDDALVAKVTETEIKGKVLGSQVGTLQHRKLVERFSGIAREIRAYATYPEIINALNSGEIDLAYIDGLSGYEILKSKEAQNVVMILDDNTSLEDGILYARVALRTADKDLFELADREVAKFVSSQEFQVLSLKYFPFIIY